jgi:hypothetical protein
MPDRSKLKSYKVTVSDCVEKLHDLDKMRAFFEKKKVPYAVFSVKYIPRKSSKKAKDGFILCRKLEESDKNPEFMRYFTIHKQKYISVRLVCEMD